MFEAQKISTRCCSQKCSSKHYKLRKRLEKTGKATEEIQQSGTIRPKVNAVSKALIKNKEFLTVKELSILLGCSRPTIYNLIKLGKIKATNIGIKSTLIKRSNIDKLFE